MGKETETLADLLRPGLRAVCIGINPSPVSVRAGHYYQGTLGRRFFSRLIEAQVVPSNPNEFMDDVAFEAGIGFTDIVKRPSPRASSIRPDEFDHGVALLRENIDRNRPASLIFVFKKTAEVVFGKFSGHGLIDESLFAESVFVMPSPYADTQTVSAALGELRSCIR